MQLIQCHKCGQFDPAWDYAHLCGPIKIKPQMNERIKKLALKYAANTGTSVLQNAEKFEEFAELIVRECAGIFEGVYTDQHRPERIDKRIKEHFGVE
jgi:hypothetical protein